MSLTDSQHVVTSIRFLTESTFVIGFTRCGMRFRSGQHLIVGINGELDQREYSIYSGENDEEIEILVREVSGGNISSKLKQCSPGVVLNVNGPFGSFGSTITSKRHNKHIFIASGTGISPFHSIVRTFPDLDYLIIHGVSFNNEAYECNEYDPERYVLCTSREKSTGYNGRVTNYLVDFPVNDKMIFHICGNGNMIYDVQKLLKNKGILQSAIITERYF
ncbi:MAG: FAD-binding oxidoreductase [Bacteroidales bacterium]